MIQRALLSVSDKSGIVALARDLRRAGVEILSTGGTARALREAGIEVRDVSEFTGQAEILHGRVKTLHPRIHGGILARRDIDGDTMASHGLEPIDLVVVNLYPFRETIADPATTAEAAVEQIDIGGPAMLRAAAKNHDWVTLLVDPGDYAGLRAALPDGPDPTERQRLAAKGFRHTAGYDAAVGAYLGALADDTAAAPELPASIELRLQRQQALRYGENPQQHASVYSPGDAPAGGLAAATPLQGKSLSFNNLLDADAALSCVAALGKRPACVIVKHANPCGAAVANDTLTAYAHAADADPTAAFGGIIAFNRPLEADTAGAILERQFCEVLAAPAVTSEARRVLAAKPNIRVLAVPLPAGGEPRLDLRRIDGGYLVQTADPGGEGEDEWRVVTRRQPGEGDFEDMRFAWAVARFVKSNAIVYAGRGRTLGIGAGQMSRVDSARLAARKAADAGLELAGAAMASDAFFPFRDSIDSAAAAGIRLVIQPGGSRRDDEVTAAADEHDLTMVFTGRRHFRH